MLDLSCYSITPVMLYFVVLFLNVALIALSIRRGKLTFDESSFILIFSVVPFFNAVVLFILIPIVLSRTDTTTSIQ